MLTSLVGGVLIGLAAVGLMWALGRIAGISGIGAALLERTDDRGWRLAFVLGLVLAPLLLQVVSGHTWLGPPVVAWPVMAVGGLLVGLGTRLGSGCTSGHGVCGLARLSPRSMVATAIFMLTGMLVVAACRHLGGGA